MLGFFDRKLGFSNQSKGLGFFRLRVVNLRPSCVSSTKRWFCPTFGWISPTASWECSTTKLGFFDWLLLLFDRHKT